MLLKDKISIVTGGSQGIGRGIAAVFSQNGATVMICAPASEEGKLKKVAEEIKAETGNEVIPMNVDVTVRAEIDRAVAEMMDRFGRIDILVNNAGVQLYDPFLDLPEKMWDLHFNVNVKGTFLFGQTVARIMIKQKSGKIINIASDSGVAPIPDNAAAYCASKSAVIGLTRNMAKELGPHNVYCNAICPGAIGQTGMMDHFLKVNNIKVEEFVKAAALQRLGTPEEIGKAALFLASDLSSFITGEKILVTGGDIISQ
jgi:NAD(P)-dependent dehydrogenase (short-subunit alcohol dehydrogenase family)